MIKLEANPSFQKDIIPHLSTEIGKLRHILLASIIVALTFTALFLYLFPKHYGRIDLTANGTSASTRGKNSVVWLSLPDSKQIQALGLSIRKSRGWDLTNGFFVSSANQPAELQLGGNFYLHQALQFSSTPQSGITEININGKKNELDLYNTVPAVKTYLLRSSLAGQKSDSTSRMLLFLATLLKIWLVIVSLMVMLRILFQRIPALRSVSFSQVLRVASVAAFVCITNFFFLLSPRAPATLTSSGGVFVEEIRGPVHLTINVDSWDFLDLAKDPGLLFTTRYNRFQGRPLYPAIGGLLSTPLRMYRPTITAAFFSPFAPYIPEFLGYISLNLILLTASILIFYRLLRTQSIADPLFLLPVMILAVNEVTKPFFWTPHLQIFNLFIPMLSLIYYCWLIQKIHSLTFLHFICIGGLLGLFSLAYGGFIPLLLGSMFVIALKSQKKLALLLMPLAFGLPILLWRFTVLKFLGSFYDAEMVEGREIIWALDVFRNFHMFKLELANNASQFVWSLIQVLTFPISLLLATYVLRKLHSPTPDSQPEQIPGLRTAFLVYFISAALFVLLIGIYRTRLTYCLVPPILLLIGMELKKIQLTWPTKRLMVLRTLLFLGTAGYFVFWIVRKGPWS